MSKTLTIRYTSDTHGYLYPTSYADMQDRPMGLMKLASEYPHDGNTLIIDGGDTIQGSPLTNLYQRLSPEEKAAHGGGMNRNERLAHALGHRLDGLFIVYVHHGGRPPYLLWYICFS